MNNQSKTRNPKKLRREANRWRKRKLDAAKVQELYDAAVRADAPVIAEKIRNMRGGITGGEAEVLVNFINIEAEINHSMTRVVLVKDRR